jgi:hypothetical protein
MVEADGLHEPIVLNANAIGLEEENQVENTVESARFRSPRHSVNGRASRIRRWSFFGQFPVSGRRWTHLQPPGTQPLPGCLDG